jgi:hypothetical protein
METDEKCKGNQQIKRFIFAEVPRKQRSTNPFVRQVLLATRGK